MWPDWIRGRVVEETTTGLGTSTVKINLPVLTEEQRNDFQTFEVEWRRLGSPSWQRTTTSTTSSSVNLPGELSDGSYEVRVRATGTGGTTLYTTPLRFPLRAIRKCFLVTCELFCFICMFFFQWIMISPVFLRWVIRFVSPFYKQTTGNSSLTLKSDCNHHFK